MQSLAFLWFDMQMTQRHLREKTFGPVLSPDNSADLNTPIGPSRRTGNTIARKLLRGGAGVVGAIRKSNGPSLKSKGNFTGSESERPNGARGRTIFGLGVK
jgi:hypothetical protein